MIDVIPMEFREAVETAAATALRVDDAVSIAANAAAVAAVGRVSRDALLRRLLALEAAVRAAGAGGAIAFSLEEASALAVSMEAFVVEVSMAGSIQEARDAVRLQGRLGILVKFRHLFRAPTASGAVYRPFLIGEDLHSVAAGAGMTWAELADFNGLDWPYIHPIDDPSEPPPRTLTPGRSQIAIPARLSGPPRAVLDGTDLGTDFLRGEGADYVSEGGGALAVVSGARNLQQSLTGQFETPLGFYPEVPDWGAFWLLPKQGVGMWYDRDWSQIFSFRLARMLAADGRVQSPDRIAVTFRGGRLRTEFDARTVRGRQLTGLEVSS